MKQIVMNFTKHQELVQTMLIGRRKHNYREQYQMVDGRPVLTPFRSPFSSQSNHSKTQVLLCLDHNVYIYFHLCHCS